MASTFSAWLMLARAAAIVSRAAAISRQMELFRRARTDLALDRLEDVGLLN